MKRLFIPFCFILFIAATCERSVDFAPEPAEPRLVVQSTFSDDMVMQIEVTESIDILDTIRKIYIKDAIVEIYRGDQFLEEFEFVDESPTVNEPYYTSPDFVPEINVLYTIKVEAEGFEPVMAESKIPGPIEISSLQIKDLEENPGPNDGDINYSYTVTLTFVDPPEEVNYYHLRFFQQVHQIQTLEGVVTILSSDEEEVDFNTLSNNNNTNAFFEGGILLEDGPFNGNPITNSFVLNKTIQSGTEQLGQMIVRLRSVSEEYYLYYNSLSRLQTNDGPPFSEEVILYNNIENGLGVFAGYTTSVDSVAVIQ